MSSYPLVPLKIFPFFVRLSPLPLTTVLRVVRGGLEASARENPPGMNAAAKTGRMNSKSWGSFAMSVRRWGQ